jgi:hypothetical protein
MKLVREAHTNSALPAKAIATHGHAGSQTHRLDTCWASLGNLCVYKEAISTNQKLRKLQKTQPGRDTASSQNSQPPSSITCVATLVRFGAECDVLSEGLEKLAVKYDEIENLATADDADVDMLLSKVSRLVC